MAELRHTTSLGARTTSSPMKRDADSSPLIPAAEDHHHHLADDDDEDRDRHSLKDRYRPLQYLSSFFGDDPRVPNPIHTSRMSLFFTLLLILVGLLSLFLIVNKLVSALSDSNISFLFFWLFRFRDDRFGFSPDLSNEYLS